MPLGRKLHTKDITLAVTFTALYVVLSFLPISQIIGIPGQITAATMIAPVIGIILGPYVGTLSTFLGGLVGLFSGSFSLPGFVAGIPTPLCSGMICKGKRIVAALVYFLFFVALAFYPDIGPAYLFPVYTWLQIVGLVVLISPLQGVAVRNFDSGSPSRLIYAFFVTSLVSTLVGQIAGSLTFVVVFMPNVNASLGIWIATALVYPIERIIIAIVATVIGTAAYTVLKSAHFPILNHARR